MTEIQWFTFIVILIGIMLEVRWSIKNKPCWRMALPWIFLFFHWATFYVTLLITPGVEVYGDNRFAFWSSILRGHSALTIVGYSWFRKNQRSCL